MIFFELALTARVVNIKHNGTPRYDTKNPKWKRNNKKKTPHSHTHTRKLHSHVEQTRNEWKKQNYLLLFLHSHTHTKFGIQNRGCNQFEFTWFWFSFDWFCLLFFFYSLAIRSYYSALCCVWHFMYCLLAATTAHDTIRTEQNSRWALGECKMKTESTIDIFFLFCRAVLCCTGTGTVCASCYATTTV